MFDKKMCENCREKISKKYNYCPYCGYLFGKNNENYGMLGETDEEIEEENPFESIIGGFGGNLFNKMFSSTIKMLEKELQRELKNQNQSILPKTNFELIINGKRINPENIKFTQKIIKDNKAEKSIKKSIPKMSDESLKKISKMPKKEPVTNIRRLSNKVVYEINIPVVKSIKDISITKLENSIEIKAFAEKENKAYAKLIPINLPITNYEFEDGKLILE